VPEDRLAVARRLVKQGRRLVERQRTIIHHRQLSGPDTNVSEDFFRVPDGTGDATETCE
jgi:hypothetical protein